MNKVQTTFKDAKIYSLEEAKAISDAWFFGGEAAESKLIECIGTDNIYYVDGKDIPDGYLFCQQVNAGVDYILYDNVWNGELRHYVKRVGLSRKTQRAMDVQTKRFAKFKI